MILSKGKHRNFPEFIIIKALQTFYFFQNYRKCLLIMLFWPLHLIFVLNFYIKTWQKMNLHHFPQAVFCVIFDERFCTEILFILIGENAEIICLLKPKYNTKMYFKRYEERTIILFSSAEHFFMSNRFWNCLISWQKLHKLQYSSNDHRVFLSLSGHYYSSGNYGHTLRGFDSVLGQQLCVN